MLGEIKCDAPTREMPVLIISGCAPVLADGTVPKPVDLADLLAKVNLMSQLPVEAQPERELHSLIRLSV
jgi:hypothetical protein